MTLLFVGLAFGLLLLFSGFKGKTLAETLWGELGSMSNASSGFARVFDVNPFRERTEVEAVGGADGMQLASFGGTAAPGGSPADVINRYVVPLARKHGMRTGTSAQAVAAANARHGPTVSGGRSDHQGPPSRAWAADMSNGNSPTPQMDALVEDIAQTFGQRVNGRRGVVKSFNWHGYRIQLLYRTSTGGNHFNHVHCGIRK